MMSAAVAGPTKIRPTPTYTTLRDVTCSWPAASQALGYQHLPGASVALGYVNRASREGTIEALREAAERITQRIQNAELPVDYQQRRVAFATLARVAEPVWNAVLADAGMADTNKRRYGSAVWLWSELTGGYPMDAPGWADTPARAGVSAISSRQPAQAPPRAPRPRA